MLKRCLAALLMLALALSAPFGLAAAPRHSTLRIRFFKIGKADAYLLRLPNHTVLIDAGEEDDGPEIAGFLVEKQIDKLDALILTHFDKRSIGGVPEVLDAVKVDRVLVPDYAKDSNLYMFIIGLMDQQNLERVKERTSFVLEDVTFTLLPANESQYNEEEDNNFSLVTLVEHGDNSFFFAGDIMAERIREMREGGLLLPHSVIKMPCHGQNIEGLDELLDSVNPQIAIIPASAKNPPAGAVIANLEARGIRWYATLNGSVSLTSDGYGISIEQTRKVKE